MGQALYRKHRPKSLREVVGQEHITTTLSNALKSGKISHAYLLTGPRGTGKTSVARILAHEVNGLEYTDDRMHLDIIEIDAASNRRIDEIRELRERVHSAPTSGKYKVYIIDEVHMLTREAFNALLKTLEEPPAHAIFILATTEAHKLPETIISRTQRFTFKPIEQSQVVAHLQQIARSEQITISDEALELVAAHGGGSFRDSISLLDQISSVTDSVEIDDVRRVLGIAPQTAILNLANTLASGTPGELVQQLQQLCDQGYSPAQLAKQLGQFLRRELLQDNPLLPGEQLTRLLHALVAVPASHDPLSSLELALLEPALQRGTTTAYTPPVVEDVPSPTPHVESPAPKQTAQKSPPPPPVVPETPTVITDVEPAQALDENTWQQALIEIKKHHNTLYSFARMATPLFDGSTLTLCFQFPIHQKRISEAKNKQVITTIIANLTGTAPILECVIRKDITPREAPPEPATSAPKADGHLETISNIFGGAEVLE
jgi:DNA polymerase-3 subunit gamma/tau